MRAIGRKLFWRSYWHIYAELSRARPYQRSVAKGVALLGVNSQRKYLDLASGIGLTTQAIAAHNPKEVIGLDSSSSGLAIARGNYPELKFVFGNIDQRLPFAAKEFDGVFAHNALYLAKDPVLTLVQIHRVLQPGGRLVMSVPKQGASPSAIFRSHIQAVHGEYRAEAGFASLKTLRVGLKDFGWFLAFSPFQVVLKLGGGGAANFWSQKRWETVFWQAGKQGARFTLQSVALTYARQNLTFALIRE